MWILQFRQFVWVGTTKVKMLILVISFSLSFFLFFSVSIFKRLSGDYSRIFAILEGFWDKYGREGINIKCINVSWCLPIHCPVEGRKRQAPIPAPIDAKTKDAEHLMVALETFFLKIWSFSALSTSSSFSDSLENNRYISIPTCTSHDATTPNKCPAKTRNRRASC